MPSPRQGPRRSQGGEAADDGPSAPGGEDAPFEAPPEGRELDRVAECRERARLALESAAAASETELRERHLDRAALWAGVADLLARHRAATLRAWLEARPAGEAPDEQLLEDYLFEAAALGTA